MENEKEIIDFGSWQCPKSWDELTLGQYQAIERYYSDKESKFDIREVLHILFGKSVDEINMLPMEFIEGLVGELSWLSQEPKWGEPSNMVEIDGEAYMVNIREKLKVGEYISVDTVLKDDRHNYATILGILCRKDGEIYDSKFENEVLPSRVKMFEGMSVVKAMRIISFFLTLWLTLQRTSELSSMTREAIDLTAKNIEDSVKSGDISRASGKSLMRKLRKLEKSIKST